MAHAAVPRRFREWKTADVRRPRRVADRTADDER